MLRSTTHSNWNLRLSLLSILISSIFIFQSAAGDNSFPDSAANPDGNRLTNIRIIQYSAVIAGGLLVFALDGDLRQVYRKPAHHSPSADMFFDEVENMGTETPYLFLAPAFLGIGLLARDERSIRTGGELAVGLLASYGITGCVKAGLGRKRPYESDSPYRFFEGGRSFYSGHTVTAFTAATVISSNYPRQNLGFMGIDRDLPVVPILAYSAATLVGVQRLYSDVHWTSDIYAGALTGYLVGRKAVSLGRNIKLGVARVSSGTAQAIVLRFTIN